MVITMTTNLLSTFLAGKNVGLMRAVLDTVA